MVQNILLYDMKIVLIWRLHWYVKENTSLTTKTEKARSNTENLPDTTPLFQMLYPYMNYACKSIE
jgi:hypothetical protein